MLDNLSPTVGNILLNILCDAGSFKNWMWVQIEIQHQCMKNEKYKNVLLYKTCLYFYVYTTCNKNILKTTGIIYKQSAMSLQYLHRIAVLYVPTNKQLESLQNIFGSLLWIFHEKS
jgi:hypothetical protein